MFDRSRSWCCALRRSRRSTRRIRRSCHSSISTESRILRRASSSFIRGSMITRLLLSVFPGLGFGRSGMTSTTGGAAVSTTCSGTDKETDEDWISGSGTFRSLKYADTTADAAPSNIAIAKAPPRNQRRRCFSFASICCSGTTGCAVNTVSSSSKCGCSTISSSVPGANYRGVLAKTRCNHEATAPRAF